MLANSIGLKFNLHVPMSDTPNDTVEAPQQQQILHVDRSEGISAARHVVLPVDDSPVRVTCIFCTAYACSCSQH